MARRPRYRAHMATTLRAARARSTQSRGSQRRTCPRRTLIEQVSERVERVVPTDGYFLAATDPETTLSIGMGVVRELPDEWCQPTWDYEFHRPRLRQVHGHRTKRARRGGHPRGNGRAS